MRCIKCGTEFEGRFCPNCGTAVAAEVSDNAQVPHSETHEKKEKAGTRSKGLLIGIIVGIVVVAAAAAALGMTSANKKSAEKYIALVKADVSMEDFSDIDYSAGTAEYTYAEVLEAVLPGGTWEYAGKKTEEYSLNTFDGSEATGIMTFHEVDYNTTHDYAGGSEKVKMRFKYWDEYEYSIPAIVVDGTDLGETGTYLLCDLMFSAYTDGPTSDMARELLNASFADVVGNYYIHAAQVGYPEKYPDVPFAEVLNAIFPAGQWSYTGDNTVEYDVVHTFSGGSERVKIQLVPDLESEEVTVFDVYADDVELSEVAKNIAMNAAFIIYTMGDNAYERLLDVALSNIEGEFYIISTQASVYSLTGMTYRDIMDTALPGGTWSYLEGNTISYSIQNNYQGGVETIQVLLSRDIENDVTEISEILVDDVPLPALDRDAFTAAIHMSAIENDPLLAYGYSMDTMLGLIYTGEVQEYAPAEYPNATYYDAFSTYFQEGTWNYSRGGVVDYSAAFSNGDVSYDVVIRFTVTDFFAGEYEIDVYLNGEKQEDDMKDELLKNIFGYGPASGGNYFAGMGGEGAFDPNWYKEFESSPGYYYNTDYGSTIMLSAYQDVLTSTELISMPLADFDMSQYVEGDDGAIIYSDIPNEYSYDGTDYELHYHPEDGAIDIYRDGYADPYVPMQRHGEGYEVPTGFAEKWYQRGTVYSSMVNGPLEFMFYDDGTIVAILDLIGTSAYFHDDQYEGCSCGGVFYWGENGEEMYYYPSIQTVLLDMGDGMCLYSAES